MRPRINMLNTKSFLKPFVLEPGRLKLAKFGINEDRWKCTK